MKKENISEALNSLNESYIAETAALREARRRRLMPRAVAAAVAVMICGAATVAAFAGGGLIDIKNPFGTITGQEYVGDATDDFIVSVAGIGEGGIELSVEKADPESKLILDDCTFIPLSYSISNSQGRTVFTSSGSQTAPSVDSDFDLEGYLNSSLGTGENGEPLFTVATEDEPIPPEDAERGVTWWASVKKDPDEWLNSSEELMSNIPENYIPTDVTCDAIVYCFSGTPESGMNYALIIDHRRKYIVPDTGTEMYFTESEELLESGTYTLYLESFIITKKGDQDIEVTGKWTTTFEI